MKTAFLSFAVLVVACGGSTSPTPLDAGSDSTGGPSDGGADSKMSVDGSPDAGGNACTRMLDTAINGTCQRCWPAWEVLCTKGNATVVEGLFACLVTDNTTCWDIGDPNSAVPCMQMVVMANGTPQLASVATKLTGLGCTGDSLVQAEAFVAMLSPADQMAYGACIAKATSTGCNDPLLQSCLSSTAIDVSLCMN